MEINASQMVEIGFVTRANQPLQEHFVTVVVDMLYRVVQALVIIWTAYVLPYQLCMVFVHMIRKMRNSHAKGAVFMV